MRLSIDNEELIERQRKFLTKLEDHNIDCAIVFSVTDIFYLTGFHFRPSERPIALFFDPQGQAHLFVPKLELTHGEEYALVDFVHTYPEYPGIRHPMKYFKDKLVSAGFSNKVVGLDAEGYSSNKGYRGPKVAEFLDAKAFKSVQGWIEEMRYIKSPAELELIKESCRWGNLAHSLLAKYSKPGRNEIEIEMRATAEATLAMVETLGPNYRPNGKPAHAFYRGQIGPHSAFPHSQTQNAVLKRGYNVISQAAGHVWGYISELERTMFIEEVSKEQEKYFNHMYEAQEIGFQAIKPGKSASSVDKAVQTYWKEEGLDHLSVHHTGHGLGLIEKHEAPFLDEGDHTILEPGMVFTVEPAIFIEGLGGFRHSDTVVVTEDGVEILTYYPRDLESLIL